MKKQRSKGITFWGYLLICMGIIYAIINAAGNMWLLIPVLTPIFMIIVGAGILNLKNWARWLCLIWMALLILFGLLTIPMALQIINSLAKEGYGVLGIIALIYRFVLSVIAIIYFSNSNVRKQFKIRNEVVQR